MNCKPGDLAIVVTRGANRDKLLRVLDNKDCEPSEWRCETLQKFECFDWEVSLGTRPAGSIIWCEDIDIRPIRDPGPDAVDETLRELEAA